MNREESLDLIQTKRFTHNEHGCHGEEAEGRSLFEINDHIKTHTL